MPSRVKQNQYRLGEPTIEGLARIREARGLMSDAEVIRHLVAADQERLGIGPKKIPKKSRKGVDSGVSPG